MGNSLKISVCDSANAYTSTIIIPGTAPFANVTATGAVINVGENVMRLEFRGANTIASNTAFTAGVGAVINSFSVGDIVELGNTTIGKQYAKIVSIAATAPANTDSNTAFTATYSFTLDAKLTLSANVQQGSVQRYWEYYSVVDRAPGVSPYQASYGANTSAADELHAVVVDKGGLFSGTPGTILEVFAGLSRASDNKTVDGAANYYKKVINDGSEYVWAIGDRVNAASGTTATVASATTTTAQSLDFTGAQDGADETTVAFGDLAKGYDQFASAESVDISLLLTGKARGTSGDNYAQLANYLIDNVAEVRKDCVVFISPDKDDVVRRTAGSEVANLTTFRNSVRSSSYAVMDSGYKYQYDRYNDVYRYIPLNGDTAGLCVRTDDTRDPWFSPAGFNRGQIKNIVKLAYNPGKADRDQLYKAGINPVVTFPGQGTILYGDKTLLANASAFDRINVRRLFIVLEKAIAKAAKSLLFEFNDDFTRAQFRNIVEPFLRDVQGRRGITAYKVVCDETNNTSQVVDSNRFVGDIYIKPARAINFIQLNFVAVRSGVEFSEVVGQF
jgi:phage tail sheath protein FI